MASVSNDRGGGKRVIFVGPEGVRKSIRLGAVGRREAERVAQHVEALRRAKVFGSATPPDTLAWVSSISPELKKKLAKVGLIEDCQEVPTIGGWCKKYIETRKDLAWRTKDRLGEVASMLVTFFGRDRRLDQVGEADAVAFSQWPELGRALNTIRRRVGWARQLFGAAVKAKLIRSNPFEGIPTTTKPNRERDYFVDRQTFQKLLDACPNHNWVTVLTLARIGGLRVPSEVMALEWSHILWDRNRMIVPCIKTA
ncbi:MAG: site-specific integrase [Gemmataceae bacterium]|nr:site-specific integrase [Gemmataceae bacterium]